MTWYDAFPSRLVLEVERVNQLQRHFILRRNGSFLYWCGVIDDIPNGVTADPLVVRIWYPEAFPAVGPSVYIVSPELGDSELGHDWHRWYDGRVCVVEPRYWQMSTVAEVIEKTGDWYCNYTAKKAGLISCMPDVGRAEISTASPPTEIP